jgi:2-keto-4-pentenoate hydratase/2-oxohepta-3-ene-1,7-dioic acid hydratase in catechol pathway
MSFGVLDGDGQIAQIEGHPFGRISFTGARFAQADIRLLSPILPSKVVCVGKNYAAHIAEMNTGDAPKEPLLFLKPSTSVIGPGDAIRIPPGSTNVHHEAELAVVIGARGARNVTPEQAGASIFGYTIGNDVTERDMQKRDGQWTRAKGFDTFCPVGPRVASGLDWRTVEVRCRVNGLERQRGHASEMQFPIPLLLAYISGIMTLEPGDLVVTGTPAGVGPLRDGDVVEVEIPGVGVLSNPVKADNHR